MSLLNETLTINTSPATLTYDTPSIVYVNASSSNILINLPGGTLISGVKFTFIRTDIVSTNTITISGGANNVQNQTSQLLPVRGVLQILSQTNAWKIIGGNYPQNNLATTRLYSLLSISNFTNSGAPNSLITPAGIGLPILPSDGLALGGAIKYTIIGTISNGTNGDTFTITLDGNTGVPIFSFVIGDQLPILTNAPFFFEANLICRNRSASGQLLIVYKLVIGTIQYGMASTLAQTLVDLTSQATLNVTFQFGTATSNNITTSILVIQLQ